MSSPEDRYKELLLSAAVSGYLDERSKLASAPVTVGKGVVKGLPLLSKIIRGLKTQKYMIMGPRAFGKGVKTTEEALPFLRALDPGGEVFRGARMMTPPELRTRALGQLEGFGGWKKKVLGAPSEEKVQKRMNKLLQREIAKKRMFDLTEGGTYWGATKSLAKRPFKTMGTGWKALPTHEKAMMGGFSAMTAADLANWKNMTPEERASALVRAGLEAPIWLATGGMGGLVSPMVSYGVMADVPATVAGKGAKALWGEGSRQMKPNAAKLMDNQWRSP
jgi:hypothetical protein